MDAIGHMTLIMAHDKLEEQLPKLLPGITQLYKKHTEHYLITQVTLLYIVIIVFVRQLFLWQSSRILLI